MAHGYIAFVLHAHLPYVRHREANRLEERWLFEAITETYIPLLWILEEKKAANFSISFSPPLLEMLADPVLQRRYAEHLDSLRNLAKKEERRQEPDDAQLVRHYKDRFDRVYDTFLKYDSSILKAFKHYDKEGVIECFTSAATHAFLPYIQTEQALRCQISSGISAFEKHFGRKPEGFWLPECAFTPGVDKILAEEGIRYTFVDEHTIRSSSPGPRYDIGAPCYSPHGVALFPRNQEMSSKIWSSSTGYPGDFEYREFYRDIAYEREWNYIKPHMHPEGFRIDSGFKHKRITGHAEEKEAYVPLAAQQKAKMHAAHFAASADEISAENDAQCYPPHLITAPFDAELFGHWWYEGPDFLSALFREQMTKTEWTTPQEYLQRHYRDLDTVHASFSTWGRDGYGDVWLNHKNAWMYRHLHKCERELIKCAAGLQHAYKPLKQRCFDQMVREWMLAASSDWAFIIDGGTAAQYAGERFNQHVAHFNELLIHFYSQHLSNSTIQHYEKEFPFLTEINFKEFYSLHDEYVEQHYSEPKTDGKNILMLSWEYPPMVVGGLSRHVYDLSRKLAEQGHNVYVITSFVDGYPEHEINEKVHVYRVRGAQPHFNDFFHWTGSLNAAIAAQGTELGKKITFDCIHAHDWLVSVAAARLKQDLNIPLIATIHATESGRNKGIFSPMQHEIHQKEADLAFHADKVIVCSEYMRKEVQSLFGLQDEKLSVLPNGIDPNLVKKPEHGHIPAASHHEATIFSVGRAVREKGFQTIIDASAIFRAKGRSIRFVIAGKGPMLEELRQAAKDRGVEEDVWFTGFVSDEERNQWLFSCDAALFPSHYEPFGIVALEGMAAGKLTIVSDTGGLSEIIDHEQNGLKIIPQDPASIVWAIEYMLSDRDRAKQIAAAGHEAALTVFNWEKIADATVDVYESCLKKLIYTGGLAK
ncbi:1,4-alpha-glucan branching protein domain-containing protein [Fictibacillus aquaticus]|uniref:Glycosyl transferase n=1 Tax=Fictibacillus aquaticus TaxID=2021314 RepID=A0A235F9D1_9BACL|nr:1,4-alpha-glucan branching protein domain-containing protein [Fictibacillus aquaticus]OYD57906.1 glycosyl transferase [Fictibacillus aquaticus]